MEQVGKNYLIINCVMKKKVILYTIGLLLLGVFQVHAQTVIGDTNADVISGAIDNTAELKVFTSTNNKGVLFPILTNTQMNGIVNPATGLILFNSNVNDFMYYNASEWRLMTYIESVSTNSKVGMYEGETKLYTTGNVLIFLNNANNWRQISIGAGTITP